MSGVGRAAERKLVFCGCEDACALLKTDADRGLDDGDVASRRLAYGPNELAEEEEEGACRKFLEQLKEPLILLLFGSAVVSSLLGQYDDAISIAVAVLIVTLVACRRPRASGRSRRWRRSCRRARSPCAAGGLPRTSRRDPCPATPPLPPLATASRGRRLVEAVELLVDESSLTGESEPVDKVADASDGAARGAGSAPELKDLEPGRTPLQQGMDNLGKKLSAASIAVIVVIGLVGVLRGEPILDVFTVGVSLAVAAIPEGLPICVAVTLALGVMRRAPQGRRAAARRRGAGLCANQIFNPTSISLVDFHTGAGLHGRALLRQDGHADEERDGHDGGALRRVAPAALAAGGWECSPTRSAGGDREWLALDGEDALLPQPVLAALDASSLCSNAELDAGQPTEVALLRAARARRRGPGGGRRRVSEVAFSSERKRMEVRVAERDGAVGTYVKGALEALTFDADPRWHR
ncbi:calcium-transporting ATPase [Aureococcus anophagefferens]|nr:calcium-transporting ATPase [Aureococcus anophagefferens]